jgi:spermidine/putrescine transport system permease protein
MRLGPLVIPDWILVVVVIVVPLGFMLARSFGEANAITLDVEVTGSTQSYRTLFGSLYRPVIARSLTLAALNVVLCLAIGLPAALALARFEGRARTLRLVAVMLPSFVSFTVRIFSWQGVLATGGPVESATGWQLLYRPPAVLIGMITAYVPLFILPAFVALSRVPRALTDAAADLGASRRQQLFNVTLPLALPGIITGAVAVGVLSVGEFVVPALLGGGKVLLLGNVLNERGAGRDQPLGGAITVTMLAIFALAGLLAAMMRRKGERRVREAR